MGKKLFASLVLLGLMCLPGMAHATPVKYDVSGSFELWKIGSNDCLHQTISGYVVINDVNTGDSVDAPYADHTYDVYQIKKFNIITDRYTFYGSSGNIARSYYDDYLFLYGDGDWDYWGFDNECNIKGLGLTERMSYGGCYGNQNAVTLCDGFNVSSDEFFISMTRSANQAPVPEPATALLLLVGAPFMYRRSKRRG